MKIGIFDPYLDDLGGGEKYMMSIAQCLAKRHVVTVFWDNKKDIDELLKRFSFDLSNVLFEKNIFAQQVSFFERLAKTKKFDAIIVLSDGSIPFSLSKKLFIHIQQPLPFVFLDTKAKFKVKRVNRFFCNSFFTKSYVDKTYGVASIVIYPPVEIHVQKQKKENIILTVGRLRVRDVITSKDGRVAGIGDYKKLAVLVETFKDMVKDGLRNWRFVLAISVKEGDQEPVQALKNMVSNFPIDFLVNKTNRQLWNMYSKAKIYWHAAGFGENLEKHPEYAEHFGISTVEAMGAGAVPIVINAGGQREIVTDGENGYLWNSLSELREKTLFVIENEKKQKQLASRSQERAKQFGLECFKKQIYELIET